MKGSIRQRGTGSTELRVYAGTDPDTGRRRWVTKTVRGTREDAERELQALSARANIAPAVGARTTMAELLDQWFARGSAGWPPATVRSVGSIVDHHLKPEIGGVLVGDLTAVMVDELYERLRTDGRHDGKPLAVGTVRRIHSTLHTALAQAVRWSWIFDNVADQASPPRDKPVEMRPPSPSNVALLLESIAESDPLLHLYLSLAATTGARRGQLLALRWIDVDLDGGSLSMQRSIVEGPEGMVLVPNKSCRSNRVALDRESLKLLRAEHDRVGGDNEDRYIFSADEAGGLPWKPNHATKRFIRVRRDAGLDHFRLHDLRHFMATEMLGAGVPLHVVAARLAHARASTTLNVYAHAIPGADRQAAEMLRRRVDQAGGKKVGRRRARGEGSNRDL